MTELAQGNIGNAGKYSVEFKGGKLVAELDIPAAGICNISTFDGKVVLDALIAKLPAPLRGLAGEIEKAILS